MNIPYLPSLQSSHLRNLYVAAGSAAFFGFIFGFEGGIIANASFYMQHNEAMKPMDQTFLYILVLISPGAATIACLLAAPISDQFGRKKTILSAILCDTIGALLCSISINKKMLIVGRLFIGVALGFGSSVVPVYISEISLPNCRGFLLTSFQMFITFGLASANIVAGVLLHVEPVNIGWRLMLSFTIAPNLIQFIIFSFMPESPRWLCANDQQEEGIRITQWLHRNDAKLQQEEIDRLNIYIGYSKRLKEMLEGGWRIMRLTRDMNALQQILVGLINFLSTIIPMLMIERFGRRKLLLSSVAGVIFALIFLGVLFEYVNHDSVLAKPLDQIFREDIPDFTPYSKHCAQHINCYSCTKDEYCGFCMPKNSPTYGYCLPIDQNASTTGSKSLIGPCSQTNHSIWYDWMDDYCATGYIVLLLVPLVTFIVFFACGYAPSSWVINAEIYPMWARSICVSISAFCNWLFDIIASTSFILLIKNVGRDAAFFIYAALTMVAFVFFFIFLSETKGTSLEDLEMGTKVNRKPMILKCSDSFFQSEKKRETNAVFEEKTNFINRN
uniref:MFS domain-containing protein n=1 Tax=Onchocerca volvulus TaxID=6282 RepID=A0A8R1TPE9_ONCVO